MSDTIESDTAVVESGFRNQKKCEVCSGYVNTDNAGYYEGPDGEFYHSTCHETGEGPDGYVWEVTDTDLVCMNRQYNCGHVVYAPPVKAPMVCPECNDLDMDDE